jgi:2-polyprenyl-3-methyl-5-hydroxy-6-metoxy-1,4-benzoquinol methylase
MISVDLGYVPFYWRTKTWCGPTDSGIPERLPFSFGFDEKLQLVIQERREDVLDWLNIVYTRDENVGYLQEGHSLAESYGNDFLRFFTKTAYAPFATRSLAEIGCGGVYLLDRLRRQGFDVVGIDPSPVTARAADAAEIRVIPEFFPSGSLNESFDVIIHYDVLEHTSDPVSFLQAHHSNLRDGGELIFAVPDCTDFIAGGDIGMMLHEHLNYFDEQSLALTLKAAGFAPTVIERSAHGGVLFCRAEVGDVTTNNHPVSTEKFDSFARRVTDARCVIDQVFDMARQRGEEVGCYVPLRAFPYLGTALSSEIPIRLFDDDPGIHGHYFDGVDHPVENFADLVSRPPKHLIIFSRAFGNLIRGRVTDATAGYTAVTTISDLRI